jgi:hypothetical protein
MYRLIQFSSTGRINSGIAKNRTFLTIMEHAGIKTICKEVIANELENKP